MRRSRGAPMEEVIVELRQHGAFVRATAVDAYTGVEATIVGSSSSPTHVLKQAAARKLQYVLEKRKGMARPERGLLI